MLTQNFQVGRPVGTGHSRPNDVIRLRRALNETGHGSSPPDPSGVYDPSLIRSIERFQSDYGLKQDGIVQPGGPTERMLDLALAAQRDGGDAGLAQLRDTVAAITGAGLKREAAPPDDPRPIVFTDENGDIATPKRLKEIVGRSSQLPPGRRPGETQVAFAPAIAAGAEAAWAGIGALLGLGTGVTGAAIANEAAKNADSATLAQKASERDAVARSIADRAAAQRARRAANGVQRTIDPRSSPTVLPGGTEPPNLPNRTETPSEPPKLPDRTDSPSEPPKLPTHTEFPIPDDPGMLIEVFPNQSGELSLPTIVENSRGDERIQNENTNVRKLGDAVTVEGQLSGEHVGGARDDEGRNKTETYLANWLTGGRLGSARPDITFQSKITRRRLFINTTDMNAAGTAATKREFESAVRIVLNGESGDILLLIAKPPKGRSIDLDALKEVMRPLLREIDNPAPEIDPRSHTLPEKLWHQWFPGK